MMKKIKYGNIICVLYVVFCSMASICNANSELSHQVDLRTDTMLTNQWVAIDDLLDRIDNNKICWPDQYIQIKFNRNTIEFPIFIIGENMNIIPYHVVNKSPLILQINLDKTGRNQNIFVTPFYIKGYLKSQQISTEKIVLKW